MAASPQSFLWACGFYFSKNFTDLFSMQITGPITADLNYIKPDAKIAPEVFYSGGAAPQKYNEA